MELRKWWKCRCDEMGDSHCTSANHRGCSLPLDQASPGCRLRVQKVDGGRHLCGRMAAMGIYPGVELELLCAGCNCPCLVRINGGTLSLGKGVSEKILVTPSLSPDS
jgi:ferrous iron transport protein A